MKVHYRGHVDHASFWTEIKHNMILAVTYLVQVGVPGDIIASLFSEDALGAHVRVTDPHCPYKSAR